MRKYIVIAALFCLFSCKNEQTKAIEKSPERKKIDIEEESNDSIFSEANYKLVFQYSEQDSDQLLGINVLDNKTIEFYLKTKTLPCDTEYWGRAIVKNLVGDGEVDSDEEGGYFVVEYFKEEKEYKLGIRLAEDYSKVQIKYWQKDSLETDCLPIVGEIMKRKK